MTAKHPKRLDRPGVDRAGRTPLHYAASSGDLDHVRRLLSEGADPAAADDDGLTPLHFAALSHNCDIAIALLDSGATVDARDANGNTPLSRAVFESRGRGQLIALLRSRGADPGAENLHGARGNA